MILWQRSDARIVKRVLSGRYNEFGVLVNRYLPTVLAVARGNLNRVSDAEDVAQETFIAAYQKLHTLTNPKAFPAWLMAIARNTAVNWQRRYGREEQLDEEQLRLLPEPSAPMEERDLQRLLHETLQRVDPETREVLLMHYFAGRSLREIAACQGITRDAAAKRLQRARETLGVELLCHAPEEMPARHALRKQAKKIAVASVAAGAVWTSKAHGAVTLFAMTVGKLAAQFIAAVAAIVLGFFVAPTVMGWEPDYHGRQLYAATTTAPQRADKEGAARDGEAAAPAQEAPADEKTYPLEGTLITRLGMQTIGDAQVRAELITWEQDELPPAQTRRWETRADAFGRFRFKALPGGTYSVTAQTTLLGGANSFVAGPEGIRNVGRIEMWPILRSYGSVLDDAGEAVAGAAVYPVMHIAVQEQEFDHYLVAGTRGIADDAGRFKLEGIIPGAWKFYVVAPNRAPYMTDFIPVYGMHCDIVLHTPGTLNGRILSASGEPQAGIRGALNSGSKARRSTSDGRWLPSNRLCVPFVSNEAGAFTLSNLTPTEYGFTVDDSALVLTRPNQKVRVDSGRAQFVELRLSQGATVSGRVFNARTQEGIASVPLNAYMEGTRTPKSCLSDSNGNYTISGLAPGHCRIRPGSSHIPGYVSQSFSDTSVQVDLDVGGTKSGKDIALEPAVPLDGYVVDASNHPMRATVSADSDLGEVITTGSGDDGSFHIDYLPARKIEIYAQNASSRSKLTSVDLSQGPAAGVVLALDVLATGVIKGHVYDADGRPAFRAMVNTLPEVREEERFVSCPRTDASGAFEIRGLSAGKYTLFAERHPENLGSVKVELRENAMTADVTIRPKTGDLSISGTVYYPSGLRCPFAALMLSNGRGATAGPLGNFTFAKVPEGEYTVGALSPGYSPFIVEHIAAGTKGLAITLKPCAVLSGQVLEAATQSPIPDFSVTAYLGVSTRGLDASHLEPGQHDLSDPQGRFRIEQVPAMPLKVRVDAPGYAPWRGTVDDPGTSEILAELVRPCNVTLRVVDDAGQPVAGAMIGRVDSGEILGETDGDGVFMTDQAGVGQEIGFRVFELRHGVSHVAITPIADAANEIEVTLHRPGDLVAHVLLDGAPATGFRYEAVNAQTGQPVPGEVNGSEIVFSHIPATDIRLTVMLDAPVRAQREVLVTVIPNERTEVDAELRSMQEASGS